MADVFADIPVVILLVDVFSVEGVLCQDGIEPRLSCGCPPAAAVDLHVVLAYGGDVVAMEMDIGCLTLRRVDHLSVGAAPVLPSQDGVVHGGFDLASHGVACAVDLFKIPARTGSCLVGLVPVLELAVAATAGSDGC